MHYLLLGVALCWSLVLQAGTLSGTVTAIDGQPLPFATLHLQGTSIGTTTNLDGAYTLVLKPGTYQVVFQYVGYQSEVRSITMTEVDQTFDLHLKPIAQELPELTITAGEDPAYRIIRKAIQKRPFYQKQVTAYTCRSYVKGVQKINNLPKTFLGQSLSSLSKGLDSTGSGILYLSESVSTLYHNKGKTKEIMSSSKVSGNDNGFSFNSGAVMSSMSFYDNDFDLNGKRLLSPIGTGALGAYRYRLETSFYDDGLLIYKIAVLPKNDLGATFGGYIYIVDDVWAIHSTDLWTTGKAVNISVLDTVTFRQTHVRVANNTWRLFSQDIQFNLSLMVIRTSGNFIGVFNNYNLQPNFPLGFFDAEVFKVEDSANKMTQQFWDSIRPVPLSTQETVEYQTKDSLQVLWQSKAYQDSLDKKINIPQPLDLLRGYTYRNSFKGYSINFRSPISNLHWNTVQGQIIGWGLNFNKDANEKKRFEWQVEIEGEYSFDDKQFRGQGAAWIRFNQMNNAFLYVSGGRMKRQFNPRNPITFLANTYYSLIGKLNYMKIYDDTYGRVFYRQRLFNGFLLQADVRYGQRSPLTNVTDFSWFSKDRDYFTNHPLDQGWDNFTSGQPSFQSHRYLVVELTARFRFGQTYISYPHQRFYNSSNLPELWLRYRKGIPMLGGVTDFDYLEVSVGKRELEISRVGSLSFLARGGWFINNQRLYFMDFAHFDANQTFLAQTDRYLTTFQLMPYYKYSTDHLYGMFCVEHHFNGFLWNKIPGLKVLGFEFVMGSRFLWQPKQAPYLEWNIGLDRIGWKLFRFLRVDAVMNYTPEHGIGWGGVIGLDFSL